MRKISILVKTLLFVAASGAIGQTLLLKAGRSLTQRVSESDPMQSQPKNLIRVPLTRQGMNYTCGPSALASILYYYDQSKVYLEADLAKELRSNDVDGTLVRDIVRFSEAEGFEVKAHYNWTLEGLKSSIDQGVPVLVLLQAWADLEVPGHDYPSDWEDGHFSVAIGYDEKNIYFMDPSTFGHYTFIPTYEFLDRWHDVDGNQKVYNFGMTITKGQPWYKHELIMKME